MTRPVSVDCPAKVNLFLEVLGRRSDGYHELATVMAAVSLVDTLTLEPARRDRLEIDPAGAAPVDPSNTVLKALAVLRRRRPLPPLRIRLVKRIPSGAGLGGGSSDAAGLVRAADRRFGLGLTVAEQRSILGEVGSDTAFFATGGAALCRGRGEIVEPLERAPRFRLVLVVPPFANPTPEVYRRLHLPLTRRLRSVTRFLNLVASGDARRVGSRLFNRLETPAFEYRPELRKVRRGLAALPFAGVLMTGSGSALFGLLPQGAPSRDIERVIARSGWGRTYAVRTLGREG